MIGDTCVILCGGKSSRMGSNKTLLPFGSYRLISYQVIKLSNIFSNIAISLKENNKNEILDILYADILKYNANHFKINMESIQIVTEDLTYFSPLFGILNCFNKLSHSRLFFIPIDYPFITLHTIDMLVNNIDNCDIVYAKDSIKLHPLVGIWKANIKYKIMEYLESNNFRIIDFLSLCNTISIYFDTCEFINLNMQQDYKNALKILKDGHGTE